MKKINFIIVLVMMCFLVGCSNNGNKNESIDDSTVDIEEAIEEKEEIVEYTEFFGLGKSYNIGKDISELAEGTEVYNNRADKPYVSGEYKEIDFANDLVQMYLSGDTAIDNSLLEEADKNKLTESLNFLKEQMSLGEGNPVYFKLSEVTYEGKIQNEKDTAILNVKGYLSADNINFQSLIEFLVSVKVKEDKILGNIE